MKVSSVVAIAVIVLACRDAAAPSAEPDPLGLRLSVWIASDSATLAHSSIRGSGYTWHAMALDTTQWRLLWEHAFAGWQPRPAMPDVNFDSSIVIMAISAETDDVRVDSLVTHELGTRVFITRCWQIRPNGDPFQEPAEVAQFVRTPRMTLAATHTATVRGCW